MITVEHRWKTGANGKPQRRKFSLKAWESLPDSFHKGKAFEKMGFVEVANPSPAPKPEPLKPALNVYGYTEAEWNSFSPQKRGGITRAYNAKQKKDEEE